MLYILTGLYMQGRDNRDAFRVEPRAVWKFPDGRKIPGRQNKLGNVNQEMYRRNCKRVDDVTAESVDKVQAKGIIASRRGQVTSSRTISKADFIHPYDMRVHVVELAL
ncbi:uncharacterized protein [Neodiprion pinetum]|uniref:uncharacterized protein n=1 Tax=Neodiprion pinetum TaxID=441929 RepID=UPI00371D340E